MLIITSIAQTQSYSHRRGFFLFVNHLDSNEKVLYTMVHSALGRKICVWNLV